MPVFLAPPPHVQQVQRAPGIPLVARKLTNLFENGDTRPHPGYCQNLFDGRGLTCGIVGFTTADGDALEVIEKWTALRPHNPLARFLPALRVLARRESGAVKRLRGFAVAWMQCAADPTFEAVQKSVAFELYDAPALRYAHHLGIKSNLGIACLYDAIVQHGDGNDPDSLGAMLRETTRKVGAGANEWQFIPAFLAVRNMHLLHAHDPKTRKAWAQSASRVRVFLDLARTGNWELKTPISIKNSDYDETISMVKVPLPFEHYTLKRHTRPLAQGVFRRDKTLRTSNLLTFANPTARFPHKHAMLVLWA